MDMLTRPTHDTSDDAAQQIRLARLTGALFLLLACCGMFAPLVLEALVVPADAAATARAILDARWLFGGSLIVWLVILAIDIATSATLSLLLRPAGRTLALLLGALRLTYSAMLGSILVNLYNAYHLLTTVAPDGGLTAAQAQALAALNTFSAGFLVALVVFGGHLVALGVALYRSGYVPRLLAILVVAAGGGYLADSLASLLIPGYGGAASALFLAPAIIGELGLTFWLLIKGVNVGGHRAAASPDTRVTSLERQSPIPGGVQ